MAFRKKQKLSQKDLKLVSDLNAALQEEKHRGLWWSVFFLASFLTAFVIWAYNNELEEVTRGQGSIIPSSRLQVIQSLDPGILAELHVKEGDQVEAGDVLVTIDDTRSSAVLRESEAKVVNLEAMLARYRSEAYDKPLKFPDIVSKELRDRETSAYKARRKALDEAVTGLQQSKRILDEQIRRTAAMVKRGVSSEIELLRMQRESADLALQISERRNQYKTEANNELVRTEAELAQARENLAMHADPVERSKIRSPVRGIVNNVKITTVGGVISAGQDIMEIVPMDDNLLVQAYIRPQDVAFVRPGLPAVVKITAYDYAIYGGLDGTVTLISPDTLSDERRRSELNLDANQSYYRVLVETKDSHLTDKNGKELRVIPGMVATVDIKTGKKTVFQYLIKPITRMKQALQER
ncbi:HlyD family type I secretion periplasmic adaptor subunit [Cardiobacterium valvarum]|uniref:Membrane fusion protein (MFP) family protein n=1 Tax=Cardiobacterium valvarum F0432 TaxID=797473 RepID=G9ZE13_9GAMM|nr:HlyD family type I secretion periplasmic adaptor subunit [Cardiobacterium valvarum]EHM55038.1 type I secretion membrane fusion protein, HlyD family [Cardiobacterium valvarum F0432]